VQAIREHGFWVRPTEAARVCAGPDDDKFLACAQAAKAKYLVTGNIRHIATEWHGTRIVTPRWLLDRFAEDR